MKNRIEAFFEPVRKEEAPTRAFWVIYGGYQEHFVSETEAADVQRRLRRLFQPRWVRFKDLFGREIFLRTDEIERIGESTKEQRDAERAFRKLLNDEDGEENEPWAT